MPTEWPIFWFSVKTDIKYSGTEEVDFPTIPSRHQTAHREPISLTIIWSGMATLMVTGFLTSLLMQQIVMTGISILTKEMAHSPRSWHVRKIFMTNLVLSMTTNSLVLFTIWTGMGNLMSIWARPCSILSAFSNRSEAIGCYPTAQAWYRKKHQHLKKPRMLLQATICWEVSVAMGSWNWLTTAMTATMGLIPTLVQPCANSLIPTMLQEMGGWRKSLTVWDIQAK